MTSFEARVQRSGDWWVITVPEIENAVTQARRLSDVWATTRDMVAAMLDVGEDEVRINVVFADLADDLNIGQVRRELDPAREGERSAPEPP